MKNRSYPQAIDSIATPEPFVRLSFDDARKAVTTLQTLYARNTRFLRDSFATLAAGGDGNRRYRAFYPEISVTTNSFSQIDSRQAYGHMPTRGHFSTTITQPDLFETYLVEQLGLIMRNHGLLTAGRTVAEAFYWMYYLEQACRIQISAQSTGAPLALPSEDVLARTSNQFTSDANKGWLPWQALRRKLDREQPAYRD